MMMESADLSDLDNQSTINVEHEVQAQPLKSVAYAFGAGAVVETILPGTQPSVVE